MTSFRVSIGGIQIQDGMILTLDKSKGEPKINFDRYKNENFTIVMVDPDASAKYHLHLLIINNNITVADYQPPNPPKGDKQHRYIFYLLRQEKILDENNIKKFLGDVLKKRGYFNFGEFVAKNNLEIINSVHFVTENK